MCRKEINANIYLLPENHTYKVPPIDDGFGKQISEGKDWQSNGDMTRGGPEFGHVA